MKKLILMLLVLAMLLPVVSSTAATLFNPNSKALSAYDGMPALSSVSPFKFEHVKKGIGCGNCPVYTAPYTNAYRAANGKASVDTNHNIDVGGFNSQGWLLVRYSTNNGSTRVGWIPPKYVKGVKTPMTPHFTYIQCTAPDTLYVSDNNLEPGDTTSWFAVLEPGETFYVVGRYNYYDIEQWYIEFDLDGQPARGFILADQ